MEGSIFLLGKMSSVGTKSETQAQTNFLYALDGFPTYSDLLPD